MKTGPRKHPHCAGFTLAEIIVSSGVLGLVSIGVFAFFIQGLNIYSYDGGRLLINKDVRSLTADMTSDAVSANSFYIYSSFQTRTVVYNGQSGDLLVLVSASIDPPSGKTYISQIIGYYRDPTDPTSATSTGPVRKFTITLSPTVDSSANTVLSLINTYQPTTSAHSNPSVVQLAQGLANGSLFYNYNSKTIIIRGQIIEQGSLVEKAINTYNFAVSPRG